MDQGDQGFTIDKRPPGQIEARRFLKTMAAEMILAGNKGQATTGAAGRREWREEVETGGAEKRQLPERQLPPTTQTTGWKEEILQRGNKSPHQPSEFTVLHIPYDGVAKGGTGKLGRPFHLPGQVIGHCLVGYGGGKRPLDHIHRLLPAEILQHHHSGKQK